MATMPRTIRDQVTNQIRDELVAGKFPAGCVLRESELASRFGVSRGPIRDAFLRLSQEGFLAYQANRGVTVRYPPDPDDREFITSLRAQVEVHAIKKGLSKLMANGLQDVKNSLENLQVACTGGDVALIARQDMEFHEAVLTGCGGEDLVLAWRQLCSLMLLTYTRLEDYEQVYREHAEIYAALEAGKKQAAVAAIKANIK